MFREVEVTYHTGPRSKVVQLHKSMYFLDSSPRYSLAANVFEMLHLFWYTSVAFNIIVLTSQ